MEPRISPYARGEACHPSFSSSVEHPLSQLVKACGPLPVTPEAAGSSPVDPAILRSPAASYGWQAKRVIYTRRMSTVARSAKVDDNPTISHKLKSFSSVARPACKKSRSPRVASFARRGEIGRHSVSISPASEPRIKRILDFETTGCRHSAASGPNCRGPRNRESRRRSSSRRNVVPRTTDGLGRIGNGAGSSTASVEGS